jgi:hypothetical protein
MLCPVTKVSLDKCSMGPVESFCRKVRPGSAEDAFFVGQGNGPCRLFAPRLRSGRFYFVGPAW